ncbi:MAG: bifunctional GTP diphosphokinase/guanosine-3',5'-bis(diphosphate) 3'-diphosphatase [Proteobacteria bacterium]|nr:bifunctional GTP diphosphokinase/guanosine-3',5'-bis(diphosphate) 3'-diphosphatase [Pseudomonadota bacterium]
MSAESKSISKLSSSLSEYLDDKQLEQVKKAFFYASNAHSGQYRSSGDPYVSHPIAVAKILADFKMDGDCLSAAILHDVIEDSGIPKSYLKNEFNIDVANLVDGVSKLDKISLTSKQEEQAENFQKMLLAMSKDIRVIVLKLADRLHNMRTLRFLNKDKQKRIATETLEIYAPIAHRLGMHQFYRELEDLAFEVIHPYKNKVLKNAIKKNTKGRKKILKKIESSIKEKLNEYELNSQVTGRVKHLYGIFKKMKTQTKSLDQVLDVYAFKITTNSVMDCYKALGILHNSFKPIEGRFKDYIAIPKSNSYQSIHTGIITFDGLPIEVQIRTNDMDELAEYGIAAHWIYKTGNKENPAQVRAKRWVNTLMEVKNNVDDPQDFIEIVKTGLVPNEIYVFTPKGDIIELPKGSTPIDFAFAVHSDIGIHCRGCRINKNLAPINVPLESGQTISIITDNIPQANPSWLEFVRTSRARSSIRNNLKDLKLSKARKLGKTILEQALARHEIKLRNIPKNRMDKLLTSINVKSVRELLEEIGSGKRSSLVVAHQIIQFLDFDQSDLIELSNIQISGSEGLVISYATCCRPIPGDNIIAHFSNTKGIVIHTERCKNIRSIRKDPALCAQVNWDEKVEGDFAVEIKVLSEDKPGLLAEISTVISNYRANIESFKTDAPIGNSIQMHIVMNVTDRDHLARIMRKLRRLGPVLSVFRVQNKDLQE